MAPRSHLTAARRRASAPQAWQAKARRTRRREGRGIVAPPLMVRFVDRSAARLPHLFSRSRASEPATAASSRYFWRLNMHQAVARALGYRSSLRHARDDVLSTVGARVEKAAQDVRRRRGRRRQRIQAPEHVQEKGRGEGAWMRAVLPRYQSREAHHCQPASE